MTDVQMLTIAVAIAAPFLAVLVGVLLNNSRLNDVKELLAAKIAATDASVAAQITTSRAETSKEIAELRVLIEKNHSELDTRLSRMETERRIV
jgi:hypothetical protein